MRKYVFGTLAAVSLIALTAPANAQDRWHHGGWGWGGGPGFGVSVGFGGPAYGYADYGWDTGYYGAYAAAPGCTCGSASYGYYPSAGFAYETDYSPSYGYSSGFAPGYSYGYNDYYYGGGSVGVSASFREGRRFRERDRLTTRTSLRERGELREGASLRSRTSMRGNANIRERGEMSTTGMGGRELRGGTQFNASGSGTGGVNGNPNPKNMSGTTGTGADTGAVSAGGRLGASTRRSRGTQ